MTTKTPYSVIRQHCIPDAASMRLDRDKTAIDVILSVVSGRVTGELERFVHEAAFGERTVLYGVRIDGVRDRGNVGLADIELDGDCVGETLRSLATVSEVLAGELAKVQHGGAA
jgi:hypothetical protein